MAGKGNELSSKCGSCKRKVGEAILCNNYDRWHHCEGAITDIDNTDEGKPW
jgi:hypothetical protein